MDSVSCSRSGGLRRVARIGRQLAALPSLTPAARVAVGDDGLASIHYETHGNPAHPALFLAHGAGGNSAVWWRNVPYLVARGYFVITHDARFFGASSKGEEALKGFTGGLTFATDAVAVLDAVGVGQATFICQSMGGTLGLHAAVHFPKRVAALVLCNTHMGVALPPRLQAIRKAHLRKVDELFGPAELFPRANTPAAIGASLGGKALGREFQKRNPELAYWYGVNGALNQRLEPLQLRDIMCPVMVTSSDYDPFFSKDTLREVAQLIGPSGATIIHFPGHGHSVYFEDPDGFNYALMDWLQQHVPSTTKSPTDGLL